MPPEGKGTGGELGADVRIGLGTSGLEQGPVAGSCQRSIKSGLFLLGEELSPKKGVRSTGLVYTEQAAVEAHEASSVRASPHFVHRNDGCYRTAANSA